MRIRYVGPPIASPYASSGFARNLRRPEGPTRAGGVLIYLGDSIAFRRREDLEWPGIESIWVELILGQKQVLFSATKCD